MLAIIGGTGLNSLLDLDISDELIGANRWGQPSAAIKKGQLNGQPLLFLARHGEGHHIPPHCINYRANIQALADAGATEIVAVNAIGGIRDDYQPAAVAVPDQLIDYTWGRAHSFSDSGDEPLQHIEFTQPFSEQLRQRLLNAAIKANIDLVADGTIGVTQGPRLETAAEVKRLQRDGCDGVGMTTMPEAALAAEKGMAYASLAVSVNWGAGLNPNAGASIHAEIEQSINDGMAKVQAVMQALLSE